MNKYVTFWNGKPAQKLKKKQFHKNKLFFPNHPYQNNWLIWRKQINDIYPNLSWLLCVSLIQTIVRKCWESGFLFVAPLWSIVVALLWSIFLIAKSFPISSHFFFKLRWSSNGLVGSKGLGIIKDIFVARSFPVVQNSFSSFGEFFWVSFSIISQLADLTPLIDTQCMDITPENPYRSLDSCLRMQSTTDKVIHMSRELWFQWYSGGFQYYFIQENALSRSLKYRSMQNTPSPQLYSQTRETSTLYLFLCLRGMWCWLTFVHEIPEKEARPYSSFRFGWFWISINNFTFSFLH